MKVKLSSTQIQFILENYETKGCKYCVDNLNINKSTITSVARRHKLRVNLDTKLKNMSKSYINIDNYTNVNDRNIAYILGLIWTDGHVTFANNNSKTPIVKHSCVYYDSECLTKIFGSLNWKTFKSENKKSIGKNTMVTNWISSRELGNYLISNNFKNKTEGTKIHESFPNLVSHFIRGLFDGDGCLTNSKSGKYMQSGIYFSSSYDQNWDYLTNILDTLNVKYVKRILSDKLGKSSQICIKDSISIYNLCEFMYKDSDECRLERKHDKYIEFLEYKTKYTRNNRLSNIL